MKHQDHKPECERYDENQIIKEIYKGLEELDEWPQVNLPTLTQLEELVERKQTAIKQQLKKDLLQFSGVAMIILLLLGVILNSNPMIFLALQLVCIVALPIALVVLKVKKQVKTHEDV